MTWERIYTQLGRGDSVTVSWRIPGGRATPALAVSLSKSVCQRLGLTKNEKGSPTQRVIVERDRMAGKLRMRIAPPGSSRHECRHVAWKDGGCSIAVPLDDVKLSAKKPAQDVSWEVDAGWLVVRLPHWACPLIQVSGKAA
jgi:hypothetical protein